MQAIELHANASGRPEKKDLAKAIKTAVEMRDRMPPEGYAVITKLLNRKFPHLHLTAKRLKSDVSKAKKKVGKRADPKEDLKEELKAKRSKSVHVGIVSAHSAERIWNGRIPLGYVKVITYRGREIDRIAWNEKQPAPRGASCSSDLERIHDENTIAAITGAFETILQGHGTAEIKRDFDQRHLRMPSGKLFDLTATKRMLQRPIYKGLVAIGTNSTSEYYRISEYADPTDPNAEPGLKPFYRPDLAIVSTDVFDAVQAKLSEKESPKNQRLQEGTFLIVCPKTGTKARAKVRCKICGGRMTPTRESIARGETAKRRVYRCQANSRDPGIHGNGPAYPAVSAPLLEDVLISKMEARGLCIRKDGRLPKRPELAQLIDRAILEISVLVEAKHHRLGRESKLVSGTIKYNDGQEDNFTDAEFNPDEVRNQIEKIINAVGHANNAQVASQMGYHHNLSARPAIAILLDFGRIKKHPTKTGYVSLTRWMKELPERKPLKCGSELAKVVARLVSHLKSVYPKPQTKAKISKALGYSRDRGADKAVDVACRAGLSIKDPVGIGYILNPRPAEVVVRRRNVIPGRAAAGR